MSAAGGVLVGRSRKYQCTVQYMVYAACRAESVSMFVHSHDSKSHCNTFRISCRLLLATMGKAHLGTDAWDLRLEC